MSTLPPLPVRVFSHVTNRRDLPAKLIESFEWDSGAGKFEMWVTHASGTDAPYVTHAHSGRSVIALKPGESPHAALARLVARVGLTRVAAVLAHDRNTTPDER